VVSYVTTPPWKQNVLLNNDIEILATYLGYSYHFLLKEFHGAGSAWGADRRLNGQEIPRPLWNKKVHFHLHKNLNPILSQFNPVHTVTHYILKTRFHISLPSTPTSPKSLFPLGFRLKLHFISPPCVLNVPPISSLYLYLARSTNYEAPNHAIFCNSS
jgi:hypothetical protein